LKSNIKHGIGTIGIEFVDDYFLDTIIAFFFFFFFWEKKFTTREPSTSMQHCSVKVFINCRKFPTPASDWSLGCVSVLVWLLLEPTTDHHLGKLLPQILANEMRASSLADSFFCFSAYKAVAAENPTSLPTCMCNHYIHPPSLSLIQIEN
jgi:hypothetical protein